MQTTRRTFFQLAGVLFPAILVNPLSFLRSLFAPDGELRPLKRPNPNPFTRNGKILVSMVRGEDVDAMLARSLSLIGGIEKLAPRGKTVLVKPNVVSGEPPPATTDPKVVGALVRLLKDAGAGKVIVGDMSALAALPTGRNLEKTGIGPAARKAGAEVMDFDETDWIEVKPPEVRLVRSIHIPKAVYEADLLINLPVVKTHRNAVYSICLKNIVGATHPRYRPYRVSPSMWQEVVAEMNLAIHPDLHIVDATRCMVSGGPWEGKAEKSDLLMASGDRVAADAVGLALLKHFDQWEPIREGSVWEQRQIRHAQKLRLGVRERETVDLLARRLEGSEAEFSDLVESIRAILDS